MFFNKTKKRKFHPPVDLNYNWIGTISHNYKIHWVYRTEERIDLPNGKNMLTIIFKLTSDNGQEYVLIGRENPVSNYWSSNVPHYVLRMIENEFLPKYDGK